MKAERCGVRNRRGVFVGAHVCSRKKGHRDQHRCYLKSDGKIFIKARPKTTTCGKRWGKK